MEILLVLAVVGVGVRWRPWLAVRRWWQRRHPALVPATLNPATPGPTTTSASAMRMTGSLVAFDARRLLTSPLTVVVIALLYLLIGRVGGDPDNATNVMTGLGAMWLGVILIPVFESVAARDRRHELIESLPTHRQRRTLGLIALAVVPAAVVYAAIWIGELWAQHRGVTFVRDPYWFELATGPVLVLGGALLGIVAGRWGRWHVLAPVFVFGMTAWALAFNSTDRYELLSVTPERAVYRDHPDDPMTLLAGSFGWHVVYLIGLCALAAVAATIFERGRWRKPFVMGLGATTLTVVAGIVQLP